MFESQLSETLIPPKKDKKVWTSFRITNDCLLLLFGFQCKSPRRDVLGILQRENKTFLTIIRLGAIGTIPAGISVFVIPIFTGRKPTEDIPFRVPKSQSECLRVRPVGGEILLL
jgi:hypothetical protein